MSYQKLLTSLHDVMLRQLNLLYSYAVCATLKHFVRMSCIQMLCLCGMLEKMQL